MRLPFILLTTLLIACDGGGGSDDTDKTGDSDDTGGGSDIRTFEDFVNTTETYTAGDVSCNGQSWDSPDPSKQVMHDLSGQVLDFQLDEGVPNITVKFWYGDDVSATPDVSVPADDDGYFTTEVPACTPLGYNTSDPYGDTVNTYEVHQVYGYSESLSLNEDVNSVSDATANIIPSIIGVAWDESATGIIAGTAFDCNEDGIGHAQIFIHDSAGNAPESGTVYYFDSNDLPTDLETQSDTNPDNGLWVAMNVSPGDWTIEMWVYNGSDYELLGSTQVTTKTGAVNISNIYTGHSDGIAYPSSCY